MTRRYRTRDAVAIVGGGDLARTDATANLRWDRRPAEGSFALSCDKQQVHHSARKTNGRSTHFCGGLLGSQENSTPRSLSGRSLPVRRAFCPGMPGPDGRSLTDVVYAAT